MTATDELRHLLDECGVEWTDCSYKDTCTAWSSNGITWYGLWRDGSIELLAHRLTPAQAIAATVGRGTCEAEPSTERIVRCRDCKHGHITIDGESCKWCDLIATHDIDGNEPNNGYDPEPYFDADFFCAWGERKEVDE